MLELLEKIILAGAGLAGLTKERAEKIADDLIARGQIKAGDRNAAVSRLLKGTKQLDKKLEKKIKDVTLEIVRGSQKQIDFLNKKLSKLARELESEKKSKKSKRG